MKKADIRDKVVSLYVGTGWKAWFSKIRFWDAPFFEVEKLIPKKGRIIDIGCGEGIFTNFMGVTARQRKILGIEIDKTRVGQADKKLSNVLFKQGDATKIKIPKCDVIVLFHLLHHLRGFAYQERVIKNCYKALKKHGKLILVEPDIKPSLKYLISWFTDHFIVPILFEKRLFELNIYFRKKKDWIDLLSNNGFSVKAIPVEEGKPFTNVIFECRKNN